MKAYQHTDIPDVDLFVPRHLQEHLGSAVNVRLDIPGVRIRPKTSLTKIAQCRTAMLSGFSELARSIDDAVPVNFPRTRIGFLFLFEIG
jgi:hypothetical protein